MSGLSKPGHPKSCFRGRALVFGGRLAPMEPLAGRTALRICPLCEANCGLELQITGSTVTSVRGDKADVFSHGFICPKGVSLGDVDCRPHPRADPPGPQSSRGIGPRDLGARI